MVAKPERENGIEEGQTAWRGTIGPRQEGQAGDADDEQMEGVDLSRDGLAPEGVGKREKRPGADTTDERCGKAGADPGGEPDCQGSVYG
jgi:hypothetical protein